METKRIFIGKENIFGLNSYKTDNIIYVESIVNYTIFHFDGLNVSKRKSSICLKKWEERIGVFLRVSQSVLLNPSFILKIIDDKIYLKTGQVLSFSRRKKQEYEKNIDFRNT